MNQDENQTGQQGYGQDPTSQQQQQPQAQQSQQQPQGQQGSNEFETGQASYGNSGQADALTQSQNSSDMGQDADMGQSSGNEGSGFIGSASQGNDMGPGGQSGGSDGMPLGTAGGGYGGSADTTGGQSSSGMAQAGSSDQDFADQGQGAMNEDLMGSDQDDDDDLGTTDIETERSQGRESDIEGSSL